MKYSVIESVFLGGYKSTVDLDFQLFFFFFYGTPPRSPTQYYSNTHLLFFSRDGTSLVAREILWDQCIKLHFSPIILIIKISGGKINGNF